MKKNRTEQKLKVLHVITGLNIGGAEMMLFKILKATVSSGTQYPMVISLLTPGPIAELIEDLGVTVHSLDMGQGQLPKFKATRKLFTIARSFKPDVLQGWMYHGNVASLLLCFQLFFKPKLIWSVRQTLYDIEKEKLLTKILIRLCSIFSKVPLKIIYNSVVSAEQHEKYGYSPSRRLVIPNGFDINRFKPDKRLSAEFRSEINIPGEAIIVGHVARYHPMKDHATLLKAAIEIIENNDNYYFVLAGKNVDHQNEQLQDMLDGVKNRERINLLGERNDVPKLMAALNLFVLSSSWGEGFPNAVGEAMSAGVPCIVTNIGDSAIVVGDTGYVISPGDHAVLAKLILKHGELSENERNALGQLARNRVEENYDIRQIVAKYNSVYYE